MPRSLFALLSLVLLSTLHAQDKAAPSFTRRNEMITMRDGAKLHVEVINDGKSIPEGATMTGLGTRIVQTLVRGELGGAVEWSNLPHGGTVATVNAVVDDV